MLSFLPVNPVQKFIVVTRMICTLTCTRGRRVDEQMFAMWSKQGINRK